MKTVLPLALLAALLGGSVAIAQTAGTAPGQESGSSQNTPRGGEPNIARDPDAKPRPGTGVTAPDRGGATSGPGGSAGQGPNAGSPTTGTGGGKR
jgi:hypothetical protein